jgi:hypothetical protein
VINLLKIIEKYRAIKNQKLDKFKKGGNFSYKIAGTS